jgi:uncharacterized membrane protein
MIDELNNPYLAAYFLTFALAMSLGVWGYFLAATPLRRVLALIAGLFLAIGIYTIRIETWHYWHYFGMPGDRGSPALASLIAFSILSGLFIGNGLLAHLRERRLNQASS